MQLASKLSIKAVYTNFELSRQARGALFCEGSGFAIGDSALRKIVRGQLNRHAVARYDSDKMLPHLAGNMSYYLMAVLKLYTELSPW